jgi:hypothetical protein
VAELILDGFHFEERFCPACDSFQWHIKKSDGTWECLRCRVRGLESSPKSQPRSILPERGKLKGKDLLPMSPEEGPPLPQGLGLKWPWKK